MHIDACVRGRSQPLPTPPKNKPTPQRDSLPTADGGGASGFPGAGGMGMGGMGGMPDLSSLAGMMGGAGGGMGGGMGGLMNNPGFMQMAQSMMQVRACFCCCVWLWRARAFFSFFKKMNPLSIHICTPTHTNAHHGDTEPGHDAARAGDDVQPRHDGPGTYQLEEQEHAWDRQAD